MNKSIKSNLFIVVSESSGNSPYTSSILGAFTEQSDAINLLKTAYKDDLEWITSRLYYLEDDLEINYYSNTYTQVSYGDLISTNRIEKVIIK